MISEKTNLYQISRGSVISIPIACLSCPHCIQIWENAQYSYFIECNVYGITIVSPILGRSEFCPHS